MIDFSAKFTGNIESGLEKFVADVQGNIIRNGAQAAAQVFYDEAKARCPVSEHAHFFYGTHQKYFFPSGTLKNALYQVYSKDRSGNGVQTYHVSWNHRKAPYGFMVEFGTSNAPAHPFIRPTYEAVKSAAGDAANQRMAEKLKTS
ncbi:MAG: hypothetical protein B7Y56_03035 [Gallionellales bacterium 35-53-114]|jgi:HK97 gp10 family phage protein|nr:MAG: hypothetical protein B7Y56_03035 [Gallionellales bacterium 35-53-114]OYZ65082.1 MAG: hypothetical protein B7Y04_00195 [Gallionellales bacterium 24-53-125]OZB07991.1 MAG: hypothetical protein B7X61_10645 [Gallionellales bacterium 39-52-133]HQS59732.1 hypothetical protein [Gallionellaceae bacterium]HQS76486.1 hypothetical protein [Gallionellaceae bacterium]